MAMTGENAETLDDGIIRKAEEAVELIRAAKAGIGAVIFGQEAVVEHAIITVLSGGHALLVGLPGLAKTKLVETMGIVLGLEARRIQFTPDLMPSDILGSEVLEENPGGKRSFRFISGPVFAQLLMADEINRASPRTQSALLQAMQEQHVTVAGVRHDLPKPFHVLATQNPLEQEGTYPLPEAQLDRFLLKLHFDYPSTGELTAIVRRTTDQPPEHAPVSDGAALLRMGALARSLPAASPVLDYASRLVIALQPAEGADKLVRDYVRLGPSPRGAQALTLAGSVTALIAGRNHLSYEDVRAVALPALRHRLILTFDAERNGVTADDIVSAVVKGVREDAR